MTPDKESEPHPLELFAGGVPPFSSFVSDFYRFSRLIVEIPDEVEDGEPVFSWTADICLIALVAHFEAFCKDLFAAVINICPAVLEAFAERRPGHAIPVADLVRVELKMDRHLGFLVAERMDFGDPRKVNAGFADLIGITPFSKSRIKKLYALLELRNLLVHHGGVYTTTFARQHKLPRTEEYQLFHQGPELLASHFLEWQQTMGDMAADLTAACHEALKSFIERNSPDMHPFQTKALDYLMIDVDRGWQDIVRDIEKDFKEPNKPDAGDA